MLRNDLINHLARYDNDPVEVRIGNETVAVEGSDVVKGVIVLKLNPGEMNIALQHVVLDELDRREGKTGTEPDDDGSRSRSMVLAAHEQRNSKPEVGC